MVDTMGIGQPFMLKVTAEQDFGEWTQSAHVLACKVRRSTALTWAARQRKIVVKTCAVNHERDS